LASNDIAEWVRAWKLEQYEVWIKGGFCVERVGSFVEEVGVQFEK